MKVVLPPGVERIVVEAYLKGPATSATVTRTALGVMQALGVICDLAALAQEYGDATAAYYDAAGTAEETPRWVRGIWVLEATPTAAVTPGTISKGMPASRSALSDDAPADFEGLPPLASGSKA